MTKINTLAAVVSMVSEQASRARPGGSGFTVAPVNGKINNSVLWAWRHPGAEIFYEKSFWNLEVREFCEMLQLQQKSNGLKKKKAKNIRYGVKCDATRKYSDNTCALSIINMHKDWLSTCYVPGFLLHAGHSAIKCKVEVPLSWENQN